MTTVTTTIAHSTTQRSQRGWAFQKDIPFVLCSRQSPEYSTICTCSNQSEFRYPVQEGDLWDLQLMLLDEYNSDALITYGFNDASGDYLYELQFLNCSGSVLDGNVTQFADDYLVGYSGENFYQLVRVDFSKFWGSLEDVFQPRIAIFTPGGSVQSYVYFPPMIKDKCYNESTVEMESTVDDFDCIGRYYGIPVVYKGSGEFQFNNFRRLFGELINNAYGITTDETDTGVVVGKDIDQIGRLRTEGLPDYAIREIVSIFGGSDVEVGGTIWDVLPSLEKNNDVNELWFLDVELEKRMCSVGNSCD